MPTSSGGSRTDWKAAGRGHAAACLEGNAFFAEELVAAGPDHDRVPHTLRDILLARVESRSPAVQELLRVVAVGGRGVPDRLLAAVSAMPEDERVEALRAGDGAQALNAAHALAARIGAEPLTWEIAMLARRARVELPPEVTDETPPEDESTTGLTPGSSRS